MNDLNALLGPVSAIAVDAGAAILEIYNRGDVDVDHKDDNSPITEADRAAHNLIEARLQALTPEIPVFSEESGGIAYEDRKDWPRFWLVDPLDGTKEFIKRNGEFTVNIALVEDGVPVLGVVHVPVTAITYSGGRGLGAFKEEGGQRSPIRCRERHAPIVMVASRRHGAEQVAALERLIEGQLGPVEKTSMGSSLKLCLVAEGAKEHFFGREQHRDRIDAVDLDPSVHDGAGAVVVPHGQRKFQIAHGCISSQLIPHWRSSVTGSRTTKPWLLFLSATPPRPLKHRTLPSPSSLV